ncbi:MAG: tRNA epoxyqueuosine(34) reductase QueG [Clostridia bacterium]|nr:tRNA epoxyqueuosine(34) reductase QueG [Clostridia bacterium]
MKERIKQYAKKLNIEYTGIAPVCRYDDLEKRLYRRREKFGINQFEETDIEKRVNPLVTFPLANSIVVCIFPYYTGEDEGANVSRYARIPDYHTVIKYKLQQIADFIKLESNAKCECFADTGVLHDRYLAYLAGLGFFGVNNCLINEKYGSYFFIGYIVTELQLEPDRPQKKECLKCANCVKNCPGGALDGEGGFDTKRCVSYITQIKELTEEQVSILKEQEMIYGCDRCQEMCPHNTNPVKTPIKEFYEKRQSKLEKNELLVMSNKEFKQKYKDFPFSWRGKAVILKNFDK